MVPQESTDDLRTEVMYKAEAKSITNDSVYEDNSQGEVESIMFQGVFNGMYEVILLSLIITSCFLVCFISYMLLIYGQ